MLEEQLSRMVSEDLRLREVFTDLLVENRAYITNDNWGTVRREKTPTLPWEGVAFMVGELKADADYSCVIEARESLKRENAELRERIMRLEHPERGDGSKKMME